MKIIHISDSHGSKALPINLPECDVLIHSGDIGSRTNPFELVEFLVWFENQPAKQKIFIPGNHDICLDKKWVKSAQDMGPVEGLLAQQYYDDSQKLLQNYNIHYLVNKDYVYEGIKFYGSPYTPSFHRKFWAFNADRGKEINTIWGKIPSDVDVLITHGPPFGILDVVDVADRSDWHENGHVGCQGLIQVINKRLTKLKLHCFGHIHDNYGIILQKVSNTRRVLFSNGAVVSNSYEMLTSKPIIIML